MNKTDAREVHFYLSLEQSSLILEALVEQPFKLVFEIIGQLNHQAQQFYQEEWEPNAPALFILSAEDFRICIKSLGDLPYNRVCALVNNLHQQLQTQQMNPHANNTANNAAQDVE